MPIQECKLKSGKKGWKWGSKGKCYSTRKQAENQSKAAYASGYRESSRNSKRA
jgi:hypothetical protein